ncbi:MAG: NADH-quinone oxidoreductase subunit C [Rickettsiales bacterium]|nr:NADH-quinone oxidoreductase subunit C [Rickettsiales bacterium]
MSFNQTIEKFAKSRKIDLTELVIDGFVGYEIDSRHLLTILDYIKEDNALKFTILTDLFGADFPENDKRFEIVYSLLSLKLNKRLILKITVDENNKVPSIVSVFNAACWYEREVFDMFGVEFEGNPDLRRILTDYGFVGHPLRKDFPVTGHVQVKYDPRLEKVVYESVLLEQEFRNFDFSSPWNGPGNVVLPGDEKATK